MSQHRAGGSARHWLGVTVARHWLGLMVAAGIIATAGLFLGVGDPPDRTGAPAAADWGAPTDYPEPGAVDPDGADDDGPAADASSSPGTAPTTSPSGSPSGRPQAPRAPRPVTNVALRRPATVSSTDFPDNAARFAVDGDLSTRWSSDYSDDEFISVDLGTGRTVSAVKLHWEVAYATAYSIQTSADGIAWTARYSTRSGRGGTEAVDIAPVSARYVRMFGTARSTEYGFSLYEFEVYGT